MSAVASLCGRKYARNAAAFVGTLFERDGTASGFYKATADGVTVMDMQRQPVAYVKRNNNAPFIVTAHVAEGRTRYMFGLSELTRAALQLPEGMAAQSAALAEFLEQTAACSP